MKPDRRQHQPHLEWLRVRQRRRLGFQPELVGPHRGADLSQRQAARDPFVDRSSDPQDFVRQDLVTVLRVGLNYRFGGPELTRSAGALSAGLVPALFLSANTAAKTKQFCSANVGSKDGVAPDSTPTQSGLYGGPQRKMRLYVLNAAAMP